MIRTLAAVAALAAVPAIAAAQPAYYSADNSNVTVLHQRPDQYSIVLNVAGMDRQTVSNEIWRAAYTVCRRAPQTGNIKDNTVTAMRTCINQARSDAMFQYSQQNAGW